MPHLRDALKSGNAELVKTFPARLPFKGMRHERLRPGEAIPSYTLTLELQLDGQHPQLEHPWSVYQALMVQGRSLGDKGFTDKWAWRGCVSNRTWK